MFDMYLQTSTTNANNCYWYLKFACISEISPSCSCGILQLSALILFLWISKCLGLQFWKSETSLYMNMEIFWMQTVAWENECLSRRIAQLLELMKAERERERERNEVPDLWCRVLSYAVRKWISLRCSMANCDAVFSNLAIYLGNKLRVFLWK
jgi:hypothetical protein